MTTVSEHPRKGYIPALRFHALTKLYDHVIGATLKEDEFRQRLLAQAQVRPGHRVLDLGCGTGTFAVLVKRAVPGAEVVGLDGDANVLSIAFLGVQLLDGFETTADNAKGLLPALMRQAGFSAVEETHREMTVFGTLAMFRGSKHEA